MQEAQEVVDRICTELKTGKGKQRATEASVESLGTL